MYLLDLPAHVRSDDLIAILIALLLLYGCTALLSKVTPLILEIVKKLVILAIIVISAHILLLDFFGKFSRPDAPRRLPLSVHWAL